MALKSAPGRVWSVIDDGDARCTAVAKHGRVTIVKQGKKRAEQVTVPLDLLQELVDGIDVLGKGDEVRS